MARADELAALGKVWDALATLTYSERARVMLISIVRWLPNTLPDDVLTALIRHGKPL